MIQLSNIQLKRLLKEAAAAGAQQAIEAIAPTEEKLTKNEVMRWLRRLGRPGTDVEEMEKEGLIKGERSGSCSNSPIYYSRCDVQQAMQALNLFPIINC